MDLTINNSRLHGQHFNPNGIASVQSGTLLLLFNKKSLVGIVILGETAPALFIDESSIRQSIVGTVDPLSVDISAKKKEYSILYIKQKLASDPSQFEHLKIAKTGQRSDGTFSENSSSHFCIAWNQNTFQQIEPEMVAAIQEYCAELRISCTPKP